MTDDRLAGARLGALIAAPPAAPGRLWLTDARLFDGNNDYPTFDALRAAVGRDAGRRVAVERDIIRIVP